MRHGLRLTRRLNLLLLLTAELLLLGRPLLLAQLLFLLKARGFLLSP